MACSRYSSSSTMARKSGSIAKRSVRITSRCTTCKWMSRVNTDQAPEPIITPAVDGGSAAPTAPSSNGHRVREIELHEVKMLNKHFVRLRDEFHLRAEVLLPREVTGDDPPPRFILERDGETPWPLRPAGTGADPCARLAKKE